jgi:hypothetical protein
VSRLGLTGEKSRITAASRHSQGFRNTNPENGAGLREHLLPKRAKKEQRDQQALMALLFGKRKNDRRGRKPFFYARYLSNRM